jgi:CRISPR-associated protein Cas2
MTSVAGNRRGRVVDILFIAGRERGEPKRLREVAPICEDFGTRKQYSVFFCRLSATDMVQLRTRLYGVMNPHKD